MSRFLICFLGVGVLMFAGCWGSQQSPGFDRANAHLTKSDRVWGEVNDNVIAQAPMAEVAGGQIDVAKKGKEAAERKIISTATLRIIVEDFGEARQQLEKLVRGQKGAFFALADRTGSAGSPRSGIWTIRVPADKLGAFIDDLGDLGEVERSTLDAKDVTEEYYDVEADLRNKKVEEEAFLNLEKSATTFDNVLAAKREVARVRNEIDRLQKRFTVLADLVSLATVNLSLHERKNYIPEATSYGASISRVWYGSLEALLKFGQNLLLVIIAVAPWLVVFGVVLGPVAWSLRRLWARKAAEEPPTVHPAEGGTGAQ
jgi:hypothetical protein